MKYAGLIICVMMALASCRPHIQETDTISERGPDSLYAAYLVMARSLPDSLGRIGPFVVPTYDYGLELELSDSASLIIGKVVDTSTIVAIQCQTMHQDTTVLKVFKYSDKHWKPIGIQPVPYPVHSMKLERMDTTVQQNEILLTTSNGKKVKGYRYDQRMDTLLEFSP